MDAWSLLSASWPQPPGRTWRPCADDLPRRPRSLTRQQPSESGAMLCLRSSTPDRPPARGRDPCRSGRSKARSPGTAGLRTADRRQGKPDTRRVTLPVGNTGRQRRPPIGAQRHTSCPMPESSPPTPARIGVGAETGYCPALSGVFCRSAPIPDWVACRAVAAPGAGSCIPPPRAVAPSSPARPSGGPRLGRRPAQLP